MTRRHAVTLKEVANWRAFLQPPCRAPLRRGFRLARTRAKVEMASRTLGYAPNALASSLTTGRTKLIGLVRQQFPQPAVPLRSVRSFH